MRTVAGTRHLAHPLPELMIANPQCDLRGSHTSPTTLTIAISAFLDGVLRRDAEQAGARFVLKPPNIAAISELLGPASTSESSPTHTRVLRRAVRDVIYQPLAR